ncbi:helix-turn-helix domain-containing protein [Clostridium tagluense]|uniref:helix-turn-helix domain-containing protein n=1 Tax=Clostridium tagluense TaxID=360422 RepID=UPI001CF5D7D4|nr:helix-turn-helix transcriptional regulator [Clostridium tagluense]MCB2297069.1 helix-turn-helix domain-containing protein [Clostridium tagluense]
MIGLEYILNLNKITQQDIATELGIRKQSVNQWIKDKKVPRKHLEYLSQKFNIPSEYFNMELKKSDELEIKLIKLKNENPPQRITKIDETEWGKHEYVEEIYEKHVDHEISLLQIEIQRQKILEEIYETINSKVEFIGGNFNEYIYKDSMICAIFGNVASILKSEKVEPAVILEILRAIEMANDINKDFDIRPLVRHLEMVLSGYEFDKRLNQSVQRYERLEKRYDEIEVEKLDAEEYKKVFISTDGIINCEDFGRLANSNQVTEYTIKTGKIVKGALVLEDGVFVYKSDNGDKIEYTFLIKNIPKLYTELLNDIDEVMEEITGCNFSHGDKFLIATTKSRNKSWISIFNYQIEENGEIDKNKTMIPRMMLRGNLD